MNKARERNWSKARLSALTFNKTSFTPLELLLVKQIEDLKDTLLKDWDKNTEEHLGIKLKPLKCHFCSRRFDDFMLGDTVFVDTITMELRQTDVKCYICQKCYDKMS